MASQIKLAWYSDLKAESEFGRMSVEFEITSIPFSKIDLTESQVNGARMHDAIRNHKVEDYMQGFRNGDTFPRVVVHLAPSGYIILSGNQRCEAIKRLIEAGELPKSTQIEVYLVGTADRMLLEIIARSANVSHGEGDTKDERIFQAVYCVQRLGMANKDAAKAFNCAESTIRGHISAEEMRSQLQRSGIEAQALPASALAPLAKLKFDESAQTKLGTLIARHNPPAERIRQVVATVEKQQTPQSRTEKIKAFERELSAEVHSSNGHAKRPAQSKVPLRPRRDKFFAMMQRLVNFLETENGGEPFSTFDQLQVTVQAEKDRAADLIKRAKYRLGAIAK